MRVHIPFAALGLTLVAAASAAAQTAPGAPLYDAPGPVDAPAGVAPAADPAMPVPAYQYVYQPDRILVIDPVTGIAMQALPR